MLKKEYRAHLPITGKSRLPGGDKPETAVNPAHEEFRLFHKEFRISHKEFTLLHTEFKRFYKEFRVLYKEFKLLHKEFKVLYKEFKLLYKEFTIGKQEFNPHKRGPPPCGGAAGCAKKRFVSKIKEEQPCRTA